MSRKLIALGGDPQGTGAAGRDLGAGEANGVLAADSAGRVSRHSRGSSRGNTGRRHVLLASTTELDNATVRLYYECRADTCVTMLRNAPRPSGA